MNFYTHGTQMTAAHGHLAFFGAYVMLNLAIITYAMPLLRGREPYNQVLNMASFWLMTGGMAFMTFTLTFAGIDPDPPAAGRWASTTWRCRTSLALFYLMRFGAGLAVVLGALLFIYSQVVVRREVIAPGPVRRARKE